MILKPQDIFIMLKLVVWGGSDWSYPALSHELSMSASEVHAGIKRAVAARLMDMHRKIPVKSNLLEFLIHGIKYAILPIAEALPEECQQVMLRSPYESLSC